MSTQKFSGLTKIKVGDKIGTQKEWKELAAEKTGLTVEQVGFAIRAACNDDFQLPDDIDKNTGKILAKLVGAARTDFKLAEDMRAAENARREQEAAELKAKKEQMSLAFKEQTEGAIVVANDFAGNLKNVIEGAVEDYFAIGDDGAFILKDDDNAEEAFAAGFARLKSLFDKSKQLGGGFALYEAKLALAAEAQFGSNWPNFFDGTDDNDVRRIQRNMKAVKTFNELGMSVGDIPVGTLLALTEVRYDKESQENNLAIKKQVIEQFLAESEKAGGPINQKEALKLVRNATVHKQATAAQKWNYIYIFADGKVGGSNQHDDTIDAVLVIDKNQRVVFKQPEGGFEYKIIPALAGKAAEKDAAEIAEKAAAASPTGKKAAKKAARAAAKEEPTNVIPMTPEPEVPAGEEEDDGLGSLGDLLN